MASIWKEALEAAQETAEDAYREETARSKVTNPAALERRNAAVISAFEALGIDRSVAEQAVKRGSGAVDYVLKNGGLDALPPPPPSSTSSSAAAAGAASSSSSSSSSSSGPAAGDLDWRFGSSLYDRSRTQVLDEASGRSVCALELEPKNPSSPTTTTFLFVHGIMASMAQFFPAAAALHGGFGNEGDDGSGGGAFGCVLYDWLGCGRSPKPRQWEAYAWDALYGDLEKLYDRTVARIAERRRRLEPQQQTGDKVP